VLSEQDGRSVRGDIFMSASFFTIPSSSGCEGVLGRNSFGCTFEIIFSVVVLLSESLLRLSFLIMTGTSGSVGGVSR